MGVCSKNIFEHNNSIFQQVRGTTIATKMAPSYLFLFMGTIKEKNTRQQ